MSDEPLLPWGHLDPSLVLAMRAAIDGQIASAGGRQNGYAAQACAAASQSYAASLRGQVETLQADYSRLLQRWDDLRNAIPATCVHDDGYEHPSDGSLPCALSIARTERDRARDIAAHLEAAVRELHKPFGGGGDRNGRCTNDGFLWPCSTIRHLEAELAKEGEPNG